MIKNIIFFIILFNTSVFAWELSQKPKINEESVLIKAKDSLTLDGINRTAVLRGSVSITRGLSSIFADTISLWLYEDNQPEYANAIGNARVVGEKYEAFGKRLVFTFKDEEGIMYGSPVLIYYDKTKEITAGTRVEFSNSKLFFAARGGFIFKEDKTHISADTAIGRLEKTQDNRSELNTVELFDNIVVKSGTAVATGQYAIYYAKTETIIMGDEVRVVQEENILETCGAQIELKTSVVKAIPCPALGIRSYMLEKESEIEEK